MEFNFEIKNPESIVIRYPYEQLSIEEIQNLFYDLKKTYPSAKIICIPKEIDYEFISKEKLITMLEDVLKYVKENET